MVKIVGYSHLWIALGALCSALATMHAYAPLALQDVSTWGIATAIGLGTGVLYTLQRRIKWARMPQNMPVDRRQFIEKWFEWVMGIWMVGGLIWLVIFWDALLPWLTALAGGWPVFLVLLALAVGLCIESILESRQRLARCESDETARDCDYVGVGHGMGPRGHVRRGTLGGQFDCSRHRSIHLHRRLDDSISMCATCRSTQRQ